MRELLQYAALILGLAISIHTLYMVVYTHVLRVRERRALSAELRLKFENILALAAILAGKATRFNEKYATGDSVTRDISTQQAQDDLAIIEAQAQQILELNPGIELSKWAQMLNKRQLARLVEFLSGYQFYHRRLEKRFDEYHASPQMWGTLARFLACTNVTDPDLTKLFNNLLGSLVKADKAQTPAAD